MSADSAEAARAAFALAPRGVAGPVAVPLGFAVLQLEAIDRQAGKSLAEASGELRRAIETEKRRAAVAQRFNTVQDAFGGSPGQGGQVLAGLSVASMFLGAIAAIGQRDIKRLMSYSSIAHMGYALSGL